MTGAAPAPLVPAEVDLRGMPFMPLDVDRLRDSDLAIKRSGDEFRAAVLLWCVSWSQLPAASLPADDRSLAAYSGLGRDLKGWKKIKAGALHGFVLCEDGRLYHPVVAEKALDAWSERVEFRDGRENERVRKQRERDDRKIMFKALRDVGQVLPWNTHTARLRELVDLIPKVNDGVTCHGDSTVAGHGPRTAKTETETETETGRGRGKAFKALPPTTRANTGSDEGSAAALARALADFGFPECSEAQPDLVAAASEGITAKELQAVAAQKPGKGIGYLVQAARGRRADAADRANGSKAATRLTTTTATGGGHALDALDPKVKAKADAKGRMDDAVLTANNDHRLQLIDEAERDKRVVAAVAVFEAAWPAARAAKA